MRRDLPADAPATLAAGLGSPVQQLAKGGAGSKRAAASVSDQPLRLRGAGDPAVQQLLSTAGAVAAGCSGAQPAGGGEGAGRGAVGDAIKKRPGGRRGRGQDNEPVRATQNSTAAPSSSMRQSHADPQRAPCHPRQPRACCNRGRAEQVQAATGDTAR